MLSLLIFVLTLVVFWWFNGKSKPQKGNFIPGPWALPLFGNVLQVGSKMHLRFAEWGAKYGDIFRVWLGNRYCVVISDPKLMKEAFNNEAFQGRQIFEGLEMYPHEPLGIVITEGEPWEVHRRFLLRQLRDFGFGKSTMEQLIIGEVNETIQRFKSLKKVSNIKEILLLAVVNSLWMVVSSKRFKHDDPRLMRMMSDSDKLTNDLVKRSIFLFMPWTRYFLPGLQNLDEIVERNRQFYVDSVNERKATYKEGDVRDFVDVYLAEMNAQKDNPQSQFYGAKAERNLHAILADLQFAGSDTTSTTLAWAVLYLSKFREKQVKLQKEISLVTGDSRQVSVADRPNMPYTLALLDEVMRISSIVPNGLQHRATTDTDFKGYFIPKDTWIFPNMYYLHHNKKIWGDPEVFRPERFLSADGTKYIKSENLLPFQIGRRQCVGETLARDSLFLFVTNIFQKFDIKLDPSVPEPNFEPKAGIILAPDPYSVIFEERN